MKPTDIAIFSEKVDFITKFDFLNDSIYLRKLNDIPEEWINKKDNVPADLIIIDQDLYKRKELSFKKLFITAYKKPILFYSKNIVSEVLSQMEGVTIINNLEQEKLQNVISEIDINLQVIKTSGVWEWDFQTGEVAFDADYYIILGYGKTPPFHSYGSWKKELHPDDQNIVEKEILNFMNSKENNLNLKFRIKTQNNDWIYLESKNVVIKKDLSGKPLHMRGVNYVLGK